MTDPPRAEHTDVRALGVRVALIYPALFVGPIVGLCLLIAIRDDSDVDEVAWGLFAVPVAALVGGWFGAQAVGSATVSRRDRIFLGVLALVGAAAGLVLGFLGWGLAAEQACHGRYECPF